MSSVFSIDIYYETNTVFEGFFTVDNSSCVVTSFGLNSNPILDLLVTANYNNLDNDNKLHPPSDGHVVFKIDEATNLFTSEVGTFYYKFNGLSLRQNLSDISMSVYDSNEHLIDTYNINTAISDITLDTKIQQIADNELTKEQYNLNTQTNETTAKDNALMNVPFI